MSTALTVAACRLQLWRTVDPDNQNSPLFLEYLNQVQDYYTTGGNWKGMWAVVDFPSSARHITLPRRYESIVGCIQCCRATPIYGQLHEYSPNGPGFYDADRQDSGNYGNNYGNWNMRSLIDEGEFPTHEVQLTAEIIRLKVYNSNDVGKIFRLFGVDENGEVIFDSNGEEGISVTLGNDTVDTAIKIHIKHVTKPITDGYVDISTVVLGVPVLLSRYEPTETNPLYRRYKTGKFEAREDGHPVFRTKCKIRPLLLLKETDLVYPNNIRAIKFGLTAVKYESYGSYDAAIADSWWQRGRDQLNQDLAQQRGAIRLPTLQVQHESVGASLTTN